MEYKDAAGDVDDRGDQAQGDQGDELPFIDAFVYVSHGLGRLVVGAVEKMEQKREHDRDEGDGVEGGEILFPSSLRTERIEMELHASE
jgi:hypothetical protein